MTMNENRRSSASSSSPSSFTALNKNGRSRRRFFETTTASKKQLENNKKDGKKDQRQQQRRHLLSSAEETTDDDAVVEKRGRSEARMIVESKKEATHFTSLPASPLDVRDNHHTDAGGGSSFFFLKTILKSNDSEEEAETAAADEAKEEEDEEGRMFETILDFSASDDWNEGEEERGTVSNRFSSLAASKEETMEDELSRLPNDVLCEISAKYLSAKDVSSLEQTSKQFREILSQSELCWKHQYRKRFRWRPEEKWALAAKLPFSSGLQKQAIKPPSEGWKNALKSATLKTKLEKGIDETHDDDKRVLTFSAVKDKVETINEAMSNLRDGDVCLLEAGTYYGSIRVPSGIHLRGKK